MDNHYVPNLTFGPMVCKALRSYGITAPIDVHLMVEPVDRIVPDFAQAGASMISFHMEASRHVHRTIQLIKSHGCMAGLVFNPATPVDMLDWVLPELDLVLLMSVNPGFGGQRFIPGTLDKLRLVRKKIDLLGRPVRLQVDGGVGIDNIGAIAEAGADTLLPVRRSSMHVIMLMWSLRCVQRLRRLGEVLVCVGCGDRRIERCMPTLCQ